MEDVTSTENVEQTNETSNEPNGNQEEGVVKPQYASVEEAIKAKRLTDSELDKFTKFAQELTKENAAERLEMLYEYNPSEVNRFYKRIFGKPYSEVKEENSISETESHEREVNPELYELKKELKELRSEINNSNKKTEEGLLDEFVKSNPEISKERLEEEMDKLNPKMNIKDKLNTAVLLLAGQGKIEKAYSDAYTKQSASMVGIGDNLKVDGLRKQTTEEAMKAKFNNPNTFPPGIRKLLIK